jgi:L-lactate dehydrogenase complex protein LldG
VSSARDEMLARVRSALGPAPAVPEVPRAYARTRDGDIVARFVERVGDYRASVHRSLDDLDLDGCVRAPGLDLDLRADDPPLSVSELDALPGVVTGCALAIAETGTIVLDGSPVCGRRALTLVPDRHVCLVRAGQIVATVPEALAALDPRRPITLVSGPSATSDIELERVEGVHGPRRLDVVVVE